MNAQMTTLAATLLTSLLLAPNPNVDPNVEVRSPSAVEVHEELIAALDRGDTSAVRELIDDSPLLFVMDEGGQPVTLSGQHSVDNLVSLWALDVEDPVPTKLVSCSVVADGAQSCTVVFELERSASEVCHLRGTSLLSKTDGENGEILQVRHLHVSPADREDY